MVYMVKEKSTDELIKELIEKTRKELEISQKTEEILFKKNILCLR